MSKQRVIVGAVAYHPRVVSIWDSFLDHFRRVGVPTDYVLYSNYEALVDATIREEIDVAWNANTAFVDLDRRVGGTTRILGMRDIDADFASVIVTRRDHGPTSTDGIRGARLAVGARDCGHSTILPIHFLEAEGLDPGSYELTRFESGIGKHGDTGEAEMQAVRAVADGEADAAALGDVTWEMFRSQGVSETSDLRIIWRSPTFCHCNFSALESMDDETAEAWKGALLSMKHEDPQVRDAMDLEGVRRWLAGDRSGYKTLEVAMKRQGYLD